jgi:valyl-tRNA synthetase
LAACARFRTAEQPNEWQVAMAGAQARAASGEFASADSILARYATRHPGTRETLETTYWRAVFKADPTNPNGSAPQAVTSLDAYLRDLRPRDHIAEAQTLRRTVARIDSLSRAAEATTVQVKTASDEAANAKAAVAGAKADANKADASATAAAADKDAEIKRLKDELAKANAELDRIRKRLSSPPPPSTR